MNQSDQKQNERLRTTSEFRAATENFVYEMLKHAGEICRIRCSEDPDLLSSIARGIIRFLGDGEVYWTVLLDVMDDDITADVLANRNWPKLSETQLIELLRTLGIKATLTPSPFDQTDA